MPHLDLPQPDGSTRSYTLGAPRFADAPRTPFKSRIAFAAAHVVANSRANHTQAGTSGAPTDLNQIDWDATMAYRRHLWSYGFAIAEAMDTSQRGMGLDWNAARELIRRSIAEARTQNAVVFSGAGTDHIQPNASRTLDEIISAYEQQIGEIESHCGRIILMASRALAACAKSADDYARVYERVLSQVRQPVIIHWLGEMFDPQLAGYWGSRDVQTAMRTALDIIRAHASKVDGIKISLLNAQYEIDMRRQLPAGVRMYTGDDFNYPELILGDAQGYSHALLGIFDAIAPAAAAAFHALDAGDVTRYQTIFEPTVALSRHIFQTPTFYYKTGITFLAYLNGHQDHFKMIGQQEAARSRDHLIELFVLADRAGLLRDPDLAVRRMSEFLKS
jgi:hypothetical protein